MDVLFLGSGRGGTAKALYSLIKDNITSILPTNTQIKIIADRECGVAEWAMSKNIPLKVISLATNEDWHKLYGEEWLEKADFIITTIHKIIPKLILSKYQNKMINVHYSLLPSFQGLIGKNTVQSAIDYGTQILGATCHHVTSEVDAGRPICQVAFANDNTEIKYLMRYCFLGGCIALVNSIALLSRAESFKRSNKNIMSVVEVDLIVNPCHVETSEVLRYLSKHEY